MFILHTYKYKTYPKKSKRWDTEGLVYHAEKDHIREGQSKKLGAYIPSKYFLNGTAITNT